MVSMYTVCAWGGLALVCSGYWYLVEKKPKRTNRASQQKELRDRERAKQKEKDSKSRKQKSTGGESSGNEAQKRIKTKKETDETSSFVTTGDNTADDNVDDREFARQLSNAKVGTTMAPRNETGSRQKSVKLSKAMTSDDDDAMRKTNGEYGSDGDDDLSSAASPELNATVLRGGDVSDMLENTPSGPSILRLTESTQPSKPKKSAPKQKEPELTKKQRQNIAKNQAAKLQREEDEKARRVLEEKQRKTAREAEGRAAKDGTSTIYTPPPPKTSAWSNGQDVSSKPQDVQLLDTYRPSPVVVHSENDEGQDNRQPAAAPMAQYSNLPSEEEQIRILSENDGWNEVKAKKSKGKLVKKTSSEVLPSENAINTTSKFDNFEAEA